MHFVLRGDGGRVVVFFSFVVEVVEEEGGAGLGLESSPLALLSGSPHPPDVKAGAPCCGPCKRPGQGGSRCPSPLASPPALTGSGAPRPLTRWLPRSSVRLRVSSSYFTRHFQPSPSEGPFGNLGCTSGHGRPSPRWRSDIHIVSLCFPHASAEPRGPGRDSL